MPAFEHITDSILRLKVPFENIYTTVFALLGEKMCMLYDTACDTPADFHCICTALDKAGLTPSGFVLSHMHGDHSGGVRDLSERFSDATVAAFSREFTLPGKDVHRLVHGERLLGRYEVIHLPGHTGDSVAVLDRVDGILLTADCLQLYGVGRYGTGVTDIAAYRASLDAVKELHVRKIVASHDYVPHGAIADGADEVNRYLATCREAVERLELLCLSHPGADAEQLAVLYAKDNPALPPVDAYVFAAMAAK